MKNDAVPPSLSPNREFRLGRRAKSGARMPDYCEGSGIVIVRLGGRGAP